MEQKLNSNIWKYAIFLVTNKRIFAAILAVYYLTIPDVTTKDIGLILLIGSLSGFIFEIPSGYISDKIGHKTALVMAKVLMLISTIFFLVADNIIFLILGAVFSSISISFNSGTGSAFMHETLRGLGREGDYAEVTGKISSIGFAVPIVLMSLVPFLVNINFKAPFLVGLIVDIIGLIAVIFLTSPKVPQVEIDEIKLTNFRQVMKEGYRLGFFKYALFSGLVGGILFSTGVFRAPYQMFLGADVIWFGVFFGIGRIFASIMLMYSGQIKKITTILSLYRFQLIFYTLLIIALGVSITWQVLVILFIIINAFQWGLSRVNNSYMIDVIKDSKFKATLLSTHSQIDLLVNAIFSFGLGLAIERFSYHYGFMYLGIVFFAVLFPLYLYIVAKHKDVRTYVLQS